MITVSHNVVFSQPDTLFFKNKICFELGGPGGHYSVNYERRVYEKENRFLSIAVGFSPTLLKYQDNYTSRFLPELSFQIKDNLKRKKNSFEYGLAFTNYLQSNKPFYFSLSSISLEIFPIIGFRRDITNKFNLGFDFTPLVYDEGYDFMPWGAIRLGYRLN